MSCVLLQPPGDQQDGTDTASGVLSSPNYPQNYPSYTDCVWKLIAPRGHFISLRFLSDLHLESGGDSCKFDFLDIFLLDAQGGLLVENIHLCGLQTATQLNSDLLATTAEQHTQIVVVHFHSDDTYTYSGFQLSYALQGEAVIVVNLCTALCVQWVLAALLINF